MYVLECIDHMLTETNLDQSSCIIAWVHVSCRILHEMMRCADARRSLSDKEYLCIYESKATRWRTSLDLILVPVAVQLALQIYSIRS